MSLKYLTKYYPIFPVITYLDAEVAPCNFVY